MTDDKSTMYCTVCVIFIHANFYWPSIELIQCSEQDSEVEGVSPLLRPPRYQMSARLVKMYSESCFQSISAKIIRGQVFLEKGNYRVLS